MLPKVVALRVRIGNVSQADSQHLLKELWFSQGGLSEIRPVPGLAAADHIINSGEGVLLMSEVPVEHRSKSGRELQVASYGSPCTGSTTFAL